MAQGQISPLRLALFFEKDQWRIQCDLVNERCASKKGDWTADQIATLRQNNAADKQWTETRDFTKMIRNGREAMAEQQSGSSRGQWNFYHPLFQSQNGQGFRELKSKAEKKPAL